MAFREKDELDWAVFARYGVVMSYVQEFEFGLIQTIGHDRATSHDCLWLSRRLDETRNFPPGMESGFRLG